MLNVSVYKWKVQNVSRDTNVLLVKIEHETFAMANVHGTPLALRQDVVGHVAYTSFEHDDGE